jgi:lipoprotein NlpD
MTVRSLAPIVLAGLGILLLSSCGGRAGRGPESPVPAYYTVQRGDTLYSIAWDAGQDYREVARWNGIRRPYLIKPGQQLRLIPPTQQQDEVWTVQRGDTLYSIARKTGVSVAALAQMNKLRPPYTIVPGQRLELGERRGRKSSDDPESRGAQTARRSAATQAPVRTNIQWSWPVKGELLSRYDPGDATRGIDISGERGTAIRAAAPGTVVYQGSGLRGYGKLIIIKHDSDFLSAYAHCDRIYVQEGNVIKGAQKIADMGSTGTNRVMLHFEIRYRGAPVDPLKYLPKT